MVNPRLLLFIEPENSATETPLIDRLTRRMCAAFRNATTCDGAYAGIHSCFCGANSANVNYRLPGREITNSLCVHYLAHHRSEIPPEQLARVERLPAREIEPTDEELQGPRFILSRIRGTLEKRLGPDRLKTWIEWGLDFEALVENLRGGELPDPQIYTPARSEAEDLRRLLVLIPAEAFASIREAAIQSHGDLEAWASEALRVPSWNRDAWRDPLSSFLQTSEGAPGLRRQLRFSMTDLGIDPSAWDPS